MEDLRVGGRRRRVYDLTEEGRAQLVEEAQRLREAAEIVTARLRALEGGQAEIDRVAAEVARRTEERLARR